MPHIGTDESFMPAYGPGMLVAGRYHLEAPLGHGGMAQVFLASDQRVGMEVAFKAIPELVFGDPRYRKALDREARLVMRLHHPHIRAVHNLEEDPAKNSAFLVMEYVPGISLDALLAGREDDRLSEPEAVEMGRQLCEALAFAHSQAVVHRDLKPKNVLLAGLTLEDAKSSRPLSLDRINVKLADFGLGTLVRESTCQLSGTSFGTSGTLPYMPPEQLRGAKPSGVVDIYGFGATLYEALSGHPTYQRGEVMIQILDMGLKPEPLTDVSPWLRDLIEACLDKDPAKRPQTAGEVLQCFDHAHPRNEPAEEPLEGAPPEANRVTPVPVSTRPEPISTSSPLHPPQSATRSEPPPMTAPIAQGEATSAAKIVPKTGPRKNSKLRNFFFHILFFLMGPSKWLLTYEKDRKKIRIAVVIMVLGIIIGFVLGALSYNDRDHNWRGPGEYFWGPFGVVSLVTFIGVWLGTSLWPVLRALMKWIGGGAKTLVDGSREWKEEREAEKGSEDAS